MPDGNHQMTDLPIGRLIKFIRRLVFKIEFEVFDHFEQFLDQTPGAPASDAYWPHQTPDEPHQMPDFV